MNANEYIIPFVFELPFSKSFWNSLNYVSTSNFQKVMKIRNPGEQSFETDCRCIPDSIYFLRLCAVTDLIGASER